MLFSTILSSFSIAVALPSAANSDKTGVCKQIKAGEICSEIDVRKYMNSYMPIATSIPDGPTYKSCKCIRTLYQPGTTKDTLKVGGICIDQDDKLIDTQSGEIEIVSNAQIGKVLNVENIMEAITKGGHIDGPKPYLQFIQAWEKTVTIKDSDGKEMKVKRYSQALIAALPTMESDKPLVELYSDTADVSHELFEEAVKAAKDFGLKTKLQKVAINNCMLK